MSYSVAGPFAAIDVGGGAWRLSGAAPAGVEILLRGASAGAAQVFADAARIDCIDLEWNRDIVIVRLTRAGAVTALLAHSAIVHEPQQDLYRCLPLAEFDAGAQTFWNRVFRLMRFPGGRFLLGLMSRRGRRTK